MTFNGKMTFVMAVFLVLPWCLLAKTVVFLDEVKQESEVDILRQCYTATAQEERKLEADSSDSQLDRLCDDSQVCKLDCLVRPVS